MHFSFSLLTKLFLLKTKKYRDPVTFDTHSHLLSKAAKPYLDILSKWIHYGEIVDPYDEFMINEKRGIKKENLWADYNDSYWEQRYTLRLEAIPPFLERWKDKILLAGKYLNVIKECGIELEDLKDRHFTLKGTMIETFSDTIKAISDGKYVVLFHSSFFGFLFFGLLLFIFKKLMDLKIFCSFLFDLDMRKILK